MFKVEEGIATLSMSVELEDADVVTDCVANVSMGGIVDHKGILLLDVFSLRRGGSMPFC